MAAFSPFLGGDASMACHAQWKDYVSRYLTRARELSDTRLLRSWRGTKLTVNYDYLSGLKIQSHQPDEEDLRSCLVTLRQFLMNDEPVFIFRIYNIAQLHLASDDLKKKLQDSRKLWSAFQRQGPIRFEVNGKVLTPERITDLWINGYYFHNDADFRVLENLARHGPGGVLARHMFLDWITEAAKQIFYVANVLRYAEAQGMLR